MGLVQNPESRVRAAAKKHLGEEAAGALWIAIKRVLPQVVCFRSFGNLIWCPAIRRRRRRDPELHENPESEDTSSGLASPLAPFQRAPFQTHCNTDSARVRTGADGGSARTRFTFHKHAVKTRCRLMSGDGRAWIHGWVTLRVSNIPTPAVRTGTGPGENCPGFFHYLSISSPQSPAGKQDCP